MRQLAAESRQIRDLMVRISPPSTSDPDWTSSDRQHYGASGIASPRPRGLPGRGRHYESVCYCDRQSVFLGATTDTKCATFPTTPRLADLD